MKKYFCDRCARESVFLYETEDGYGLCRECYEERKIKLSRNYWNQIFEKILGDDNGIFFM